MIIEKRDNAVFANDDIVFSDINSDIVTLFSNDIGFNSINLNNIDDDSFHNFHPKTINQVRHMTWYNRYKQHKACKK